MFSQLSCFPLSLPISSHWRRRASDRRRKQRDPQQRLVCLNVCHGVSAPCQHDGESANLSRFLSPEGRCYSFDDRAEGYGRGEGVGCIMLKPLEHALRDRDTIRAIVRNTGSNQDGKTPGITFPSGDAQTALIRSVYAKAGLNPSETAYVEAHGTGTQAGDPIEAGALSAVFGKSRPEGDRLRIGSVKSNLGHLEGASGVAGLIKSVLMLENRVFLPSRNFVNPNKSIPLDQWGLQVGPCSFPENLSRTNAVL
jgi:acyl transferase domain-containing protein